MSAEPRMAAVLAELRIERGSVTDEELAALAVVLLARAAACGSVRADATGTAADGATATTVAGGQAAPSVGWAMRPLLRQSARAWETRRSLGLVPRSRPGAGGASRAA